MASTTSNGATVDNLNVLDTLTSDNIGGSQIIALQDIAYALFATTNATQLQTIDNAFWTDNLTLTFQAAGTGQYYTLWATSLDNFSFAQSDHYGNLLAGSPAVTFSANSASAFLSAFSSNPSLAGSGLSSTSLLASLDINSSIGKNVFQATLNGQIANVFSYASATDSFNGTGSQWDVINNFKAGVDKLDFRKLLNDNMIVGSQGGQTASSAGLGEFFWKGQQSANTTNLGAAGAFAVWYTTDGSGGSFVYTDTNGDGIADLKVNVTGASTLTPSDFLGVDPPAAFTVKINPIEPSQSNPWLLNSADAVAGVTITGTVANFTSSAHLIVSLNGHNYTATVASNGTWSAVIPAADLAHNLLPDGSYTLGATVKVGSSTAASDSHSLTVDETPPAITINTIAGDNRLNLAESASNMTISGTATGVENGQTVSVVLNGHTYTGTVSNNVWSVTAPAADLAHGQLADGSYSVTANVQDLAGNPATQASKTLTVDETPPVIAINTIAGDNRLNLAESASNLTISGTATGVENG
ncbi:Ig-like domain-containing protein, partial [Mesorhizobium sp. B2-4-12]|uniref:Ig-like domain-containing protein n=1 Tax=Mesorhizobium sp. B2-4-12 TaxID=2589937 RepID=UPI00112C90F8